MDTFSMLLCKKCKKGGCCVNQTTNLGSVPMLHPSSSAGTCVFVLHAAVSRCHSFVSGAKGVRKYNTNTWLERGSDTVVCHRFNQSDFHYLLTVLGGKKCFEYCRKVMIFQQLCVPNLPVSPFNLL